MYPAEMIPFKNRLLGYHCTETLREKSYPVVEMEFHPSNQVEYVICPARIDDKVADKARAIALGVSENSSCRITGGRNVSN
jgi:5-(carboxyamino)imidazole ribonucleotide synthase